MPVLTLVEAVADALRTEMERDPTVLVLGEDVGKDGGVFRATSGLQQKFGENRVIDTPLAENAIIGCSIGLALGGFKPVAEAQFDGFSIPMLDQLINHASRLRTRSNGSLGVPLVLRFPYGGGIKALEHHSDSPETHYVHTPGLKVVVPSTPYDCKGLLISAIRDSDPVIFMEPKRLYRAVKEEVPEDAYTVPLGKAKTVVEGNDVTVLAWGAMARTALAAIGKLQGVSAELVDLRTLSPLDEDSIIRSVKKTGRCVIVQEAPKNNGFGAELAALIAEKALLSLEAPIERVAGWDTVPPLPKQEQYYFPSSDRIARAIERVARF